MCPAPGMIHSCLGSSAASYRRRPWCTGTVTSRSPWIYGIGLMRDKAIAALTCGDSGEFIGLLAKNPIPVIASFRPGRKSCHPHSPDGRLRRADSIGIFDVPCVRLDRFFIV